MVTGDLIKPQPNLKLRDTVTLVGVVVLLANRFFLTGFGMTSLRPTWLEPAVEVSAYLVTAFLIWWERDRLADYHIDALAIALILFFKPFETLYLRTIPRVKPSLTFPALPALAIWAIALALLVALLVSRPKGMRITRRSLLWLAIGAGVALVEVFVTGYPSYLQTLAAPLTEASRLAIRRLLPLAVVPGRFLSNIPYQLGYAAAYEEPIFRGFLWGYLRNKGWKDWWILLLQAGLFWSSHLYYLGRAHLSFWVLLPEASLLLGWLAWRSRSIATSMVAHSVMNAGGMLIGTMLAGYVF